MGLEPNHDNKELKDSMFQNVFGYQSQDQNSKKLSRPEESVPESLFEVHYAEPDKSNLPAVFLDQIPLNMRANSL
jgi:hypothetical protein